MCDGRKEGEMVKSARYGNNYYDDSPAVLAKHCLSGVMFPLLGTTTKSRLISQATYSPNLRAKTYSIRIVTGYIIKYIFSFVDHRRRHMQVPLAIQAQNRNQAHQTPLPHKKNHLDASPNQDNCAKVFPCCRYPCSLDQSSPIVTPTVRLPLP